MKFLTCVLFVLVSAPVVAQQETILQTLQRLRPTYPERPSAAQAAALLNDVAWIHRNEGLVLLGKTSGGNCPQPKTGILISCDFLVDAATKRGWDVLIGWDETRPGFPAAVPTFGGGEDLSAAIARGARSLVPPVDTSQSPSPTPTPAPVPAPLPSLDLSGVYAQFAILNAKLDELARASGDAHAAIEQNVTDGRKENQTFFDSVKSTWQAIGVPIVKYVLPAVATFFAGKAVAK